MKTIKLIAAFALIAFTTVSCVEKSEKYKALLAQRDSLQLETQTIEGNYNETISILNEVESGFAAIRETEGKMLVAMPTIEGQPANKKQHVAAQLNQIKEIIAANKEKISTLQGRLSKMGKDSGILKATIERMQAELNEKSELIASLQTELTKKNVKIDELVVTVDNLNKDVANLNDVSEKQQGTIKNQDADLNTVWYVVASAKELKEAQILSGNGLFRAKTVMDKEFDRNLFLKKDLREVSTIEIDAKKAKVLSSHPQDSYKLTETADKKSVLEITNPAKFWSISKYLVIQK